MLTIPAGKQPRRSSGAEFRTARFEMNVDHAQYITRDLELDRPFIFGLAVFQNQLGSAITGTVQVAFQVDVSQVRQIQPRQ